MADAEEVLVHLERTADFVGHWIALFVGLIEIAGELVIDEQSVLVVVAEFETVDEAVRCHHIEVVAGGGDRHLAIIVFGDVDFLHHGQRKAVAGFVEGAIDLLFFFAVGAGADGSPRIAHAQDGVNGIDLVVSLDVAFDGRRRGFDDFLEEVVHLVVGAAQQAGQCQTTGAEEGEIRMFHCGESLRRALGATGFRCGASGGGPIGAGLRAKIGGF